MEGKYNIKFDFDELNHLLTISLTGSIRSTEKELEELENTNANRFNTAYIRNKLKQLERTKKDIEQQLWEQEQKILGRNHKK